MIGFRSCCSRLIGVRSSIVVGWFQAKYYCCMISLIIVVLLSCSRFMDYYMIVKFDSSGISQDVVGRLAKL